MITFVFSVLKTLLNYLLLISDNHLMRKHIFIFLILLSMLSVQTSFAQGYLMFAGGGSETNSSNWAMEPYGWFVDKADGNRIVILSQSDTSPWLQNYFTNTHGAAEAVTLTISGNSESEILSALDNAGGVFLKGGDQQNYIDAWKGTPVESAIMAVFQNGGVIGGTSAGAMVGGQFISASGPISSDNLRNPFNGSNTVESDFLGFLPNTIFDSHYFERGRIGRLLGLIGRIHSENNPAELYGIGLDDQTAVMIEPDGTLTVSGTGGVHIFRRTTDTDIFAQPNQELDIRNLEFHQLTHGFKINLFTGEILAAPNDAVEVEPADYQIPTASYNFRKSFWTNGYLQSLSSDDEESAQWIVLDGGGQNASGITNVRASTEVISFNAALTEDADYIQSLFEGHRLFINLSMENWSVLAESDLFKEALFTNETEIELYLEHGTLMGDGYVTNAGADGFISYDGRLQVQEGFRLMPGVVLVDSTYQSSAYFENRATAVGWLMHSLNSHIGISSSGLTRMNLSVGTLRFPQQTIPTVIFDARDGYITARSPFSPSGSSSLTRNAAAISRGLVHVVATGGSVKIYNETDTSVETADVQLPEATFSIVTNYPNPFNPTTTVEIASQISQQVDVAVFDITGRRILNKPNIRIQPGSNFVTLNLNQQSSGLYLLHVSGNSSVLMRNITLLK